MGGDLGRETRTTEVGREFESDVTREMTAVGFEDLSDEWILKSHRRAEFGSRMVPFVGEYPLLRRLGRGGMGDVFSSVHPRLGVDVAVKLLRSDLSARDSSMRGRFLREARLAAKLSIATSHLVRVHDVDIDQHTGVHFLVMEFVKGISAARWCGSDGTCDDANRAEFDVLQVVIAATRGLCHAHRRGVIHRDIKPDNILIPVDANVPQLALSKLADLGLARTDQSSGGMTTAATTMLGTPGFASPEQIESARTARKPADVYGMGATIYALLTGRAPHDGDNAMARALATLQEPPTPLRDLRSGVSESVAALVATCLARDPQERFQDGVALLEALYVCSNAVQSGPTFDPGAAERVVGLRDRPAEGRSVLRSLSSEVRSGPPRLLLHGGPPGADIVLRHKDGDGSDLHLELDANGVLETDGIVSGSFELTATHPDFHRFEVVLSLRAGTDVHCMLPMREREGYLTVESNPNGATVFVDGVEVATTPTPRLAVAPGRHELQVKMRGFGTYERVVEVRGGIENDIGTIELAPMGWLDTSQFEESVAVLIDGRALLHGDDVAPGARTISIQRAGYETQLHQVEVAASEALIPRVGRWRPNPWKMLGRVERWVRAPEADRERCGRSLELGLPPFTYLGLRAFGGESLAVFHHAATGLDFVLLPGATYAMGSSASEPGRRSDERVHSVTLDPFVIACTVVTQRAWRKTMDALQCAFDGDDLPLESVTWHEANSYCTQAGLALPTEAQWEYACRAGGAGLYSFGDDARALHETAWFRENAANATHPVGKKAPNAFGLHDMHGGVWEWCADGYSDYPFDAATEPIGPDGADYHVFRGGSWSDKADALRSARRGAYRGSYSGWNIGFRPALRIRKGDLAPVPSGDSSLTDGVQQRDARPDETRSDEKTGE